MKRAGWVVMLALALVYGACGGDGEELEAPTQVQFGGDRPVFLSVPDDYDHAEPTPLLIVLHGYGASSYLQLTYTGLRDLPEEENVLMLAPDAVMGDDGQPSWHVGDYCCDRHDTDDLGYLRGLVDEVSSVWNVDPNRVYVFGHSNGGNMSYYLGCEASDMFAAVASLAGPTPVEGCEPGEPVNILHIHGDEDEDVKMAGGTFSNGYQYASTQAGLDAWAVHDGCGSEWSTGDALDIDVVIEGAETTVDRNSSCPEGRNLELWTIQGGGHTPAFDESFRRTLWAWLSQQSK